MRGVGPTRSERNPMRQQIHPNHRNLSPCRERAGCWNGGARIWYHNGKPEQRQKTTRDNVDETTFFFNNIPEDCSVDFLKRKFESVASITDIYLPKKRDIMGRPFGFVRFQHVDYEDVLLAALNQIWIGTYKIRVYKPKYGKEKDMGGGGRSRDDNGQENGKQTPPQQHKTKLYTRVEGVSFREVLTGRKDGEPLADETLQFQSMDTETEWLCGAYTGYIKNEFLWEDILEEINSDCMGYLKVKILGGNLTLIQSTSDKTVEEALEELNEWRDFWFQWTRPWSYVDVNQQRIVWTKWSGVPLNAWNPRFFNLACGRLGMALKIDETTSLKNRLDEAFVQISTGFNSVNQLLCCKIDGASFQIRIEEVQRQEVASTGGGRRVASDDSESDWTWEESAGVPANATIGASSESGDNDFENSVNKAVGALDSERSSTRIPKIGSGNDGNEVLRSKTVSIKDTHFVGWRTEKGTCGEDMSRSGIISTFGGHLFRQK